MVRDNPFKDFYFSTYFKVLEFVKLKGMVLKTELLYLGGKKQQIKTDTLDSILEVLLTQKYIELDVLNIGRKKFIQIKYVEVKENELSEHIHGKDK